MRRLKIGRRGMWRRNMARYEAHGCALRIGLFLSTWRLAGPITWQPGDYWWHQSEGAMSTLMTFNISDSENNAA